MPTKKIMTETRLRPGLHRVGDEMKEWSAMLGNELGGWPHVKSRPMFGLLGFYRKAKIFAALPKSRGIGGANSVIFKIHSMSQDLLDRAKEDSRVGVGTKMRAKEWYSFEVNSSEDLRDVLWWLNQAYELAK
jgi:hypothetical protein